MRTLWGLILIVVALLLCWGGQVVNALFPKRAERWGLSEPQAEVDPVFYTDSRGEAFWDVLSIWPLPVAGVLLLLDHPWWPYFGLVGGGIFIYFSGRGTVVRLVLRRHGIRIGHPKRLAAYYIILFVWALLGAVTIAMAVRTLEAS
ncbi:MAG TPA: hypothetical protein DCZ95_16445 [Verrucomicrobia bacterium]|nr:hypothetical protein [Verrucomicrobiota bacterium]